MDYLELSYVQPFWDFPDILLLIFNLIPFRSERVFKFFFEFVVVCFKAQNETARSELCFCFGNYQYTKCSKV